MLFEPTQNLAGYTVVDVRDPAEMDERSSVSSRLPGRNAAHRYRLRDPDVARLESGTLLSRFAMRRAGDLQISHAFDRFGTAVDITEPGMPAYCFGFINAGRIGLSRASEHFAEAPPGGGPIHGGQPGTRLLTSDGTRRTNLWLAAPRFETALAASLNEPQRARLVFAPTIDWSAGPGARLRLLFAHAEVEMGEPDGFAANPLALASFIDLFVHTALRILPHNHADTLSRPDRPAPAHLRRAEAYLDANVDAPLRLEDLAAAAGCSTRSLQRAFRQFRETTPHAAIQAARLDRARAELARGSAPIAAIARSLGFTKRRRFATAYARRFGVAPRADPWTA